MDFNAVSPPGESVVVVMDVNRSKGSLDALDWALRNIARPKDTVIVLGVIWDSGKTSSCFRFLMGIGISGIWERLEFAGQGEVNPRELEEELEIKKSQFQSSLQPFYRQCRKYEVNLEVKLTIGVCPCKLAVEETQNSNVRWIVLDSHLKKHKLNIWGHVYCKVVVMNGRDFATFMPPRSPEHGSSSRNNKRNHDGALNASKYEGHELENPNVLEERVSTSLDVPPKSPCCFSDENVMVEYNHLKVYQGILEETPVLVKNFSEDDERFWLMLKILSRLRHRNIVNLVGYCCTGASMFLLSDFPCMGNIELNLRCDDFARKLSWKARWHIALEIGGSLRYLHEECVDGPIAHLSVCSRHIVFSHDYTAMLDNFITAKCLKDDLPRSQLSPEESPTQWTNLEDDERLSVDVHDYGLFLIELITGKSGPSFEDQGESRSLLEWAVPFLEGGLINIMDTRLTDTDDNKVVHNMAYAALCLPQRKYRWS
ncbi:Mitogen-activated protein kinase kinase kinase [Quillaja saponaria]|uniref:Mitogen-activated protein kinase kinase kinase n=1 Tax=Quillaja saponaria TaxID=32244 RepID=A0AAD7M2Z3_QUISA|nr:Mitogen-activated protein kinase kinase kinase [Quillaja saponaria]